MRPMLPSLGSVRISAFTRNYDVDVEDVESEPDLDVVPASSSELWLLDDGSEGMRRLNRLPTSILSFELFGLLLAGRDLVSAAPCSLARVVATSGANTERVGCDLGWGAWAECMIEQRCSQMT